MARPPAPAIFNKGLRPHYYCLPVLKRERHRQALLRAIQSGSPKFFLGTDSAPHATAAKESDCGCAGVFTAHAALGLYAEAFDGVGALDKLRAFACEHGPDFYGLPRNNSSPETDRGYEVRVERAAQEVPESFELGGSVVRPLRAGETVAFSCVRVPQGGK